MLKRIQETVRELFQSTPDKVLGEEELRVASAALLVHCARADGHQSDAEDARLRDILCNDYDLSELETDELIATAELREADATDVHRFTRVLHRNLDRDGRIAVVGKLWQVAHADAQIDHDERRAVNLIASLLDVEIADVVALRRRIEGGAG